MRDTDANDDMLDEWADITKDADNLNSDNMFNEEMAADAPVGAASETHDTEQGEKEVSSVDDGGDSETGIRETRDGEISILAHGVNPADFTAAADKSQLMVRFLSNFNNA